MRQKLSLALALGLDVPLVMLDEPFNGLDVQAQDELSKGLRERVKAGNAVLVTAHQGDVARNLLERGVKARVMQIEDGELHQIDLEKGVRIEREAFEEEASA
jgi:ABC-2 type transport system ATP-binding protein